MYEAGTVDSLYRKQPTIHFDWIIADEVKSSESEALKREQFGNVQDTMNWGGTGGWETN